MDTKQNYFKMSTVRIHHPSVVWIERIVSSCYSYTIFCNCFLVINNISRDLIVKTSTLPENKQKNCCLLYVWGWEFHSSSPLLRSYWCQKVCEQEHLLPIGKRGVKRMRNEEVKQRRAEKDVSPEDRLSPLHLIRMQALSADASGESCKKMKVGNMKNEKLHCVSEYNRDAPTATFIDTQG